MHRSRDHRQCPEALADPDAQHVQLQERVVDRLASIHVHEEVVEKASAPRSHRAEDVAPRQEPVVIPHQFGRHRRQNIYNRDSWSGRVINRIYFWLWVYDKKIQAESEAN